MRYFEVEFGNTPEKPENQSDEYSICILGEKEPTKEQAAAFCNKDMVRTGYKYVTAVTEIDKTEAETFFDMERAEERFPVFK